jgi:hypothetical protein
LVDEQEEQRVTLHYRQLVFEVLGTKVRVEVLEHVAQVLLALQPVQFAMLQAKQLPWYNTIGL